MDSKNKALTIAFFDARVSAIDQAQTITSLEKFASNNQFHHVMTPNTEMIMRARRDPAFRTLLNQADLAPADGIGLVWAARFLYQNKKIERVAGADLVTAIIKIAASKSLPVLLINKKGGIDNASAAKASQLLADQHPDLVIHGLSLSADEALSDEIKDFQPAILLVGLGAPEQDFWIAKHRTALPSVHLAMGVGGSFDFITGIQKRAPILWQRLGLEWLWRLIHHPSRLRRQLAIPHFMWLILLIKLKLAKNQSLR